MVPTFQVLRPGKGTEDYMSRLLRRLATVGSLFLGFITIIPILARDVFGLTDTVALGGTSLLSYHLNWY